MERHGIAAASPAREETQKLLEGLNERQREAVQHVDGPLLILAGPGSEKTRVICHRIAWIVGTGAGTADAVLGITFTNKAANEMRERLGALLGHSGPGALLSTYHSFCAQVLRADGRHVEIPSSFMVYDVTDQVKAAALAIEEIDIHKDTLSPRYVVWQIGQWKNRMLTPDEVEVTEDGYREKLLVRCYAQYEKVLRRSAEKDPGTPSVVEIQSGMASTPVRSPRESRWRQLASRYSPAHDRTS